MANSIGSLYDWTEAELLAALRAATKELADGVVIVEFGSGDVNGRKQLTNNPRERIAEIKANLYTLFSQDSATYPQYEGFALEVCNTVRASFSSY